MKIVICEDDIVQCGLLESLLFKSSIDINVDLEIESFTKEEEVLEDIFNDRYADIYLLDIEIGKIGGIELAKCIRKNNKKAVIVFVTNYMQYMSEAFDVHAYYYLQKPVGQQKINRLIENISEYIQETQQKIFFEYNREKYAFNLSDVIYFESNKRLVVVVTIYGKYQYYGKISQLNQRLPKIYFTHVASGCIVNMNYIIKIDKNSLLCEDYSDDSKAVSLNISRNYYNAFITDYKEFVKRNQRKL